MKPHLYPVPLYSSSLEAVLEMVGLWRWTVATHPGRRNFRVLMLQNHKGLLLLFVEGDVGQNLPPPAEHRVKKPRKARCRKEWKDGCAGVCAAWGAGGVVVLELAFFKGVFNHQRAKAGGKGWLGSSVSVQWERFWFLFGDVHTLLRLLCPAGSVTSGAGWYQLHDLEPSPGLCGVFLVFLVSGHQ